ncbi:hypothetical protein [Xenorhabdus budapestensis]|uniref:Uncharacterized protein n=1 Tax=Xenorhabdus budapestensis TaxID=290110 RepID=A0A2D0J109_XENBU|nr:hypothetical protein [Xenorhabdus budapestensis]PHM28004.1 hypothetical protein Xbud_01731 [Xenorhabdus budapestensis]QTL38550.1 hypothetical protein HGO23_11595 [Xenorhabdus budapestensis]
MEGKVEDSVINALKEMMARAVMLGLSCSENKMQGSILDEQNVDIVSKLMSLYESTNHFLTVAGIEKAADEILPLYKEIISQLPEGRL